MKRKIRMIIRGVLLLTLLSVVFIVSSCGGKRQKVMLGNDQVIKYKTPKYVFFFIGDGMAIPQVRMAEAALSVEGFREVYFNETGISVERNELFMSGMPVTGMATSNAQNRFITGSAAAATALATGEKTIIDVISMNSDTTQALITMAEIAKREGKKVGILTSVSLDHATPACFYAHTENRNDYEIIGEQLLASGFDFFAGGFLRHDTYEEKSLEDFLSLAKDSGYLYVDNKKDFEELSPASGKILATIAGLKTDKSDGMALPYNIDMDIQETDDQRISLADFTKKGIELLDNKEGFFMMIEGGKIDWTGHANDVVSNVYETVAFDDAIGIALDFYEKHPDETLIVVTGDHETGGMSLGFAGTYYETSFGKLMAQNISFLRFSGRVREWAEEGKISFEEVLDSLEASFGLGDTIRDLGLSDYEVKRLKSAFDLSMNPRSGEMSFEERSVVYGYYDPLTVTATHILGNKAGIDWTSYSHTALPVVVFAIGQGQELFNGYYDNTDIAKKIMKIGGYNIEVQ